MPHLDAFWRDLRHAARVLLRSPLFTLSAVLTLALCIGANTAIYTVVDHVLFKPLPYPEPDRLAAVITHFDRTGDEDGGQTGSAWLALHDASSAVDLAVIGGTMGVNFVSHDQAEYVKQQRVSAGFFRVLGVPPLVGREITEDEDRPGGPAVVVLSHALWARALNSDRDIIGRAVILRGEPYTVVGVMPEHFLGNAAADVWTPLRPSPRGEGEGQNYEIIARVKPGVSWTEADSRVAAAGDRVMRDLYDPAKNPAHERLMPLQRAQAGEAREPLLILWTAVGAVLLIGCVNIAGLLIARSAGRAPEMATRMALGGGRAAIVRQLLSESLLLAMLGGAAGIALGYVGVQVFSSVLQDAFGVGKDVALNGRVLAATAAASFATSVAFGLLPAFQASRVDLRAAMGVTSVAGTAHRWPRRLMVGAEVALGVVLLVGAGLLLKTFDRLMHQRPGFDSTHVMSATLSLQDARYATAERVNQLFDRSLEGMRGTPGVESAAVALTLPYERALNMGGRFVGGKTIPIMNLTYVTSGYFDTLRIPIQRGRVFTEADSANAAPVMIVNLAFVKRYSKDEDPIGRQAVIGGVPRTIVGVVDDIQQKSGWGNFGPVGAAPAGYTPAAQMQAGFFRMVHTWFSPSWIVRSAAGEAAVAVDMQRVVQRVDPLLPFAKFRTLESVRNDAVAGERARATLLGSLALLALLLSAVGIYGLVANSVAERTRELGIRIALGATPLQTLIVAAAPGVVLGAVGVAIGLVGARAGARVMQSLVWNVSVGDPATFALAAGVVFVVAVVATIAPSLSILRLDPVRALRQS